MKTDELIDFLATVQEPVDPRRLDRLLFAVVGLGVAGVLALVVATLGARPDLPAALTSPAVWLKHAATLLLLVTASAAFASTMRPGAGRWRAALPLLAVTAVGTLALAQLATSPVERWHALVFGRYWLSCLTLVPLYAALPFLALLWVAREGAPVRLRAAGALAGCLAGALSAVGYAVHCTDDTAPFVFVWYGLAILSTTLLGALVGPRLLRW